MLICLVRIVTLGYKVWGQILSLNFGLFNNILGLYTHTHTQKFEKNFIQLKFWKICSL